jgi:hypothetical protein
MTKAKKKTRKFDKKLFTSPLILASIILIVSCILMLAAVVIAYKNDSVNFREFTINGRYDVSEIRINVNAAEHTTINARDGLLTLGFNPNHPITQDSEFLARYIDAETGAVVEVWGQTMENYAEPEDLPGLLAKAEEYRLEHTGQSLVFDRHGNISVNGANSETLYSGGYVWGGYTLAVVILDPDAPAPRHNSKDFLFFSDNEEIMQGSGCRRIIVREKANVRRQGSIELLFGARCPSSPQPR